MFFLFVFKQIGVDHLQRTFFHHFDHAFAGFLLPFTGVETAVPRATNGECLVRLACPRGTASSTATRQRLQRHQLRV